MSVLNSSVYLIKRSHQFIKREKLLLASLLTGLDFSPFTKKKMLFYLGAFLIPAFDKHAKGLIYNFVKSILLRRQIIQIQRILVICFKE